MDRPSRSASMICLRHSATVAGNSERFALIVLLDKGFQILRVRGHLSSCLAATALERLWVDPQAGQPKLVLACYDATAALLKVLHDSGIAKSRTEDEEEWAGEG